MKDYVILIALTVIGICAIYEAVASIEGIAPSNILIISLDALALFMLSRLNIIDLGALGGKGVTLCYIFSILICLALKLAVHLLGKLEEYIEEYLEEKERHKGDGKK